MKIAFVCTGNSARSQMAEALARHMAGSMGVELEVYSAGSRPEERINPYALKVMDEVGISLKGQRPKGLEDIPIKDMHLIITLCDSARNSCPVFPGQKSLHWDLPDPARFVGTEEERLEFFRRVREEIRKRVEDLLLGLKA
ncbi:MAG: arsenate reductase ArsC [Acidobacteria bacterium]|nr:MAG: arsenate reductase ArsC [Acidobacteriota bacterium]